MSPVSAGLCLVLINVLLALGTVIANTTARKEHIPPIYLMFIGFILPLIGIMIISTVPNDNYIASGIYGYEIIASLELKQLDRLL